MIHLNPDELLHAGHGWLDDPEDAIAQAHVESCEECADAVGRIRTERDVLHAAASNPEIPLQEVTAMTAAILTMPQAYRPARPAFVSPGLGLTLAASILAVAAGLVLFESRGGFTPAPIQDKQETPVESEATRIRKLVRGFVAADEKKSRDAKAALLKIGKPAIRILIEEQKALDGERFYKVSDLLFTLKFQGDLAAGSLKFRKAIGSRRWEFHGKIDVCELFDGWRVVFEGERMETNPSNELCQERLLYEIIDRSLRDIDLDYAVRFGMVLVAPPERLWAYPGTKSRPGDGATVDRWIADLDSLEQEKRQSAEAALLDMDDWVQDRLRNALKDAPEERRLALDRILLEFDKRHKAPLYDNSCAVDGQALTPGASDWAKVNLSLPTGIAGKLEIFQRLRLDLALLKIAERTGEKDEEDPLQAETPKREPVRLVCSELMADTRLADLKCSGETATGQTTLRDVLILLLRPAGLDFCIREGTDPAIVVDHPAAIRALIEQQEKSRK